MRCPDLEELLNAKEGENVEFKEAKKSYEFDKLAQYACALANHGGGWIALGVRDHRPREVVGTRAFPQPERTRAGLITRLRISTDFAEISADGKRVLVFLIPPRPFGTAIQDKGIYWSRRGDSLVPMEESELRAIFAESGHDFSSDICLGADWADLDQDAIEEFRVRWIAKSGNVGLAALTAKQLLTDCEAIVRGAITYAALILFGKREALGRLLGQAEVIFEYRSTEASGPAEHRMEFRQGFFGFYERLWSLINLRNPKQHFQDGLFLLDVSVFEERIVREAILNAISHRDYQLGGSVFVRQYPHRLVVESPGGFPPEITLENILDRQSPRNRRIADIFARCGLVERSGQGMNLMFEISIKQAKRLPDFRGTDRFQVVLALDGNVQDPELLKVMEEIGQETLASFSTQDFLVVNAVYRGLPVPEVYGDRLPCLLNLGIVERGARRQLVLGRRFYEATRRKGEYTRRKGLDRDTRKALVLQHIADNATEGTRLEELYLVLPGHNRGQIQILLRELREEGQIYVDGRTRGARWYPAGASED